MLEPSVGTSRRSTWAAPPTEIESSVRLRHGDVVVERDRLVDRVERVEAVLARGADAQVEVDLRGRPDRDAHAGSGSRDASLGGEALGDPREVADVQHLAADGRVDARRLEGGGRGLGRPGQLAQRRPDLLAAVGEGGVHDGEDLLAGGGGLRRVAAGPGDESRVDVGGRPEDVATDRAGTAYVREPRRLHAGHAVGLRPGRRGEPVGDLGLHHHQPALQRRQQGQQVDQHRDRDVVGQVGDQRGRRRTGDLLDAHRVGQHDLEAVGVVRCVRRDGGGQPVGEERVDLDRHHAPRDVEEGQGQRAEAGADLDDDVVAGDAGLAHDPAHGVGVDDEVLPALLGRAQVELGGELTHLGRPEESRAGRRSGHAAKPSRGL